MVKLSRNAHTNHGGDNGTVLTLHLKKHLLTSVTHLKQLHAKTGTVKLRHCMSITHGLIKIITIN